MGGMVPVPARPQPMVAGGRVLGEDGRERTVTGPIRVGEKLILSKKRPSLSSGTGWYILLQKSR